MYGAGIPVGMLTDYKGPRPALLFGSLAVGIGYYLIHRGIAPVDTSRDTLLTSSAYDSGQGSFGVFSLCLFSFLTGVGSSHIPKTVSLSPDLFTGSCAAFFAAIKTC